MRHINYIRKVGKKTQLHNARMDTQKLFYADQKYEKRKRYTQLFPFYRLGILLFLSLFFTAFSLSLFIASDTAAPKKSITRRRRKERKKYSEPFSVDPELKKRRKHEKRQSHFFAHRNASHRPKIILQKIKTIRFCVCRLWPHNTTIPSRRLYKN